MQTPFTFLCCYQSCGYRHLAKLEMVCCFSFPSLTSIINDSADTCITLHIQVTKHRLQQSEQKCPVCSLSRCGKGVDRNKPAARAGLWICWSCKLRSMHDVPSQLLDSETKLWLVGVYQDGNGEKCLLVWAEHWCSRCDFTSKENTLSSKMYKCTPHAIGTNCFHHLPLSKQLEFVPHCCEISSIFFFYRTKQFCFMLK